MSLNILIRLHSLSKWEIFKMNTIKNGLLSQKTDKLLPSGYLKVSFSSINPDLLFVIYFNEI